jgi:hypothetical protein
MLFNLISQTPFINNQYKHILRHDNDNYNMFFFQGMQFNFSISIQ